MTQREEQQGSTMRCGTRWRRIRGWAWLTAVVLIGARGSLSGEAFLVRDGKPNAEVVIAEERPRMATLAALELQYYIQKISGARLPIVTEPGDKLPVRIYVGKSRHTDKLGVADNGLKYGAFRMMSGPDHLVLLGGDRDFVPPKPWPKRRNDRKRAQAEWDKRVGDRTDSAWGYPFVSGFKAHWNREASVMAQRYGKKNEKLWPGGSFRTGFWVSDVGGSLNAVYEFLRMQGARWYMPGEIGEVIPEMKSIALPALDKTVRPDYDVRSYTWYNYSGFPFEHIIWARRTGMNSAYGVLGNMGYAHGLCIIHARKEMQEKHPEYYALVNGKRVTDYRGRGHVCFSSEGFFQETLNFARFMFDEYDQPHISLWPMDGFRHCRCESCKDIPSSELVWGFVDRVARELHKTHPDRLVSCGAYTPYIYPPKNVEKFTPNVLVFISNTRRPLMDDPAHWEAYWSRVEGWREKVAPGNIMRVENNRFGLWGGFPVIHPHNMAKDLRALKGISRGECCEESQKRMRWHSPGKDHLTLYVQARFLWDADQDVDALLDEYFALFYGPARDAMKRAIEFAEANYSRTDKSRPGGRCNPLNVPLSVQVRLGELLLAAREKAGDTVYGKRIQTIIDELTPLDELRQKLAEQAEAGDPRAKAPVVVAKNVSQVKNLKTYRLRERVWKAQKADQNTSFTVAWDKKALVFDVRCQEPDMRSVRVTRNVWDGDSVVILLEPPGHSYYHIEINPDGRVFDADRAGGGKITPRWESMTEVNTERGQDYWRVKVRIPIAIVGKEGAEGDPYNYVVGPEPGPGSEWFFNIARRRPRPGRRHPAIYSFAPPQNYSLHVPDSFARLRFE